jgi:hypothetical protein
MIDYDAFNKGKALDNGTQGVIFQIGNKMTISDNAGKQYECKLVFKEYKQEIVVSTVAGVKPDDEVLKGYIDYVTSKGFDNAVELLSICAWPLKTVYDHGDFVGFLMPAVPNAFYFKFKKKDKTISQFYHLLNEDSFISSIGLDIDDALRYKLLLAVAKALKLLHSYDIRVGDLSPKNLLFKMGDEPGVMFIDCDSMQLGDTTVMGQVETGDWNVRAQYPDEELGTKESDIYKLGLLALRLFAGHQQYRSIRHLPDRVDNSIRQRIDGSLREASRRPSIADWELSLQKAADRATAPPIVKVSGPGAQLACTESSTPAKKPALAAISKGASALAPEPAVEYTAATAQQILSSVQSMGKPLFRSVFGFDNHVLWFGVMLFVMTLVLLGLKMIILSAFGYSSLIGLEYLTGLIGVPFMLFHTSENWEGAPLSIGPLSFLSIIWVPLTFYIFDYSYQHGSFSFSWMLLAVCAAIACIGIFIGIVKFALQSHKP